MGFGEETVEGEVVGGVVFVGGVGGGGCCEGRGCGCRAGGAGGLGGVSFASSFLHLPRSYWGGERRSGLDGGKIS